MFSRTATWKSTEGSLDELKAALAGSDTICAGLGAGMSAASGFSYSGERFMEHFSDFHGKYGINDMYSGGFYPFETPEEYWAWWSRAILINRYDCPIGEPCDDTS